MDWLTLSQIIGHRDPKTTLRYSHNMLSFYRDKLFQYHPLLRRQQSFKMVTDALEKFCHERIDTEIFGLKIIRNKTSLTIKINT